MKEKRLHIDDTVLTSVLHQEYGLKIKELIFIPMGTSAYSYEVHCKNGSRYYLKMFDTSNERQRQSTPHLDIYLRMTWKMYHHGIFPNLTYPIQTKDGEFKTTYHHLILVLFNFIEGTPLWDVWVYSTDLLDSMAKLIAAIHNTTPHIEEACYESFDITFVQTITHRLSALESTVAWNVSWKKDVKQLMMSNKDRILEYTDMLRRLQLSVQSIQKEWVLCHGDLWGGNIIKHQGQFFLIDWETSVMAPPERDLFFYMETHHDFEFFFHQYEKYRGGNIKLHAALLRFYAYRRCLQNINSSLGRLLDSHHVEEGTASVVDQNLTHLHCIESVVYRLQKKLSSKIIE